MNKKLIPVILASATLLFACNEEKANDNSASAVAPVSKEDAVAVVNGQYISKASLTTLEAEITQRSRGQSFPQEQLVDELIQRELLVQDAVQKQLDKTAEFTERLETVKKSLLSQVAIQNYLKSNTITDAELKAEYDKNAGKAGTEYKARHILVKTEDEAKQIIVELNNGADFAELAKTKSTGPSGPQGGDLGWFTADQMVGPFSEATIALKDGKYTTEAVETQFGWHIILREGTREQTPPPFESVKEQIRPALQRQKMKAFLDDLRKQAKVEILLAKPAEQEKAVAPETKPAEATTTSEASDDKSTEIVVEEVIVESVDKSTEIVAEEVIVEDAKTKAVEAIIEVEEVVVDKTNKTAETIEEKAVETTDTATKAVDAVAK